MRTIKKAYSVNSVTSVNFLFSGVFFVHREYTRLPFQEKDEDEENYTGDFDVVVQCINGRVLCGNQAISMAALHEVYGLRVRDKRYRGKLKKRILLEIN